MPDWEAVLNAWPLIAAVAGVWGRVEVALVGAKNEASYMRKEAEKLDDEIKILRRTMDEQSKVSGNQAVQLGRIEETLSNVAAVLARLEQRLDHKR